MIPAILSATAQGLEADSVVHLYELDTTSIGGEVLRFTSGTQENAPVSFGSQLYGPAPIETTGWEMNARGTLPRPVVRVANVNNIFGAVVNEFGDLVGCGFRRIRTFRRFLDGQPDADGNVHYPIDYYRVEQKSAHNKIYIEWTLASAMDQQGRMIPNRQVIQRVCTHKYRRWTPNGFDYSKATCPYTGSTCFDRNGQVTTPDKDQCSKLIRTGCIPRFGKGTLPTRAFPGVGRSSVN